MESPLHPRETCHVYRDDPEFAAALQSSVVERLTTILAGLGILYGFCALHLALIEQTRFPVLIWLAAGAGAFCLVFWSLARNNRMPACWAHPVAALLAALVLVNSLSQLHYLGEPSHSMQVVLLAIGVGYTFLSWRWLVAVLAVSFVSWAVCSMWVLTVHQWILFGFALSVSTGMSAVVHRARLNSRCREREREIEQEHRERELECGKERYELAVRGANDGLWYWDLEADHVYYAPRWSSMLGFAEEDIGPTPEEWFDRVHPYYLPGLKKDLQAHLSGETEQFESKYRIRHADGSYRWVLARGLAVRDSAGKAKRLAGSQTDITQLIEVEQRLLHDALHDKLTGLPNRNYLMKRLQTAVERDRPMAVVFMDLDRFKMINDTLGHLAGDQLIKAAANRLRTCQRTGDTVARLGGDEFVVLLEGLNSGRDAESIAERIREAMAAPFDLEGEEVITSASIGIAFRQNGENSEELLRNADIAMYQAKARGKGQVQVFHPGMHDRIVDSWNLQHDLRQALEKDELILFYQPLISLSTGRITGVEALLRWRCPNGQLLPAAEVIPVAEEIGLIEEIGEWALRGACQQNRLWLAAGLRPVRVSVNLSSRQLKRGDFVATVKTILRETGLDPRWLELELTETTVMDNLEWAKRNLDELSSLGIRLSLDDFGTGYSALSQLREFSFDVMKIDRTFVSAIGKDESAAALMTGLITLGRNLKLEVTAEGVEDDEQLRFLAAAQCDRIQGFLASAPVPAEEFAALLRSDEPLIMISEKSANSAEVPPAGADDDEVAAGRGQVMVEEQNSLEQSSLAIAANEGII